MTIIPTNIEDCFMIDPQIHRDDRGYFYEYFNKKKFTERTQMSADFVQDNMAYSQGQVFRGFHFQKGKYAQAKLISVLQGSVHDVVIDLRRSSSSYGRVVSVILDAHSKKQFYVPRGCAHGYLTLSEEVRFFYKCDNYYAPEHEGGLRPTDTTLSIPWEASLDDTLISDRDLEASTWEDCYKFD